MAKTSKNQILIGADPELFFKNNKGQYVSAHDVLPGTKTEPFKVNRGAIQVDGVAAEFNIDPAASQDHFVTNIANVMQSLRDRSPGLTLCIEPYAVFDKTYFDSLPEHVKELGCTPDFDAYTGKANPKPDGETTMRTASGHIHLGWTESVAPFSETHFEDCQYVIKELDFWCGLYSMAWDPDGTRRALYGQAGAFRPKSYGAEYRVMSNAWLKTVKLQQWVYGAAWVGMDRMKQGRSNFFKQYGNYARDVIKNNDIEWNKSSIGNKICNETGMSWPPVEKEKSRQIDGNGIESYSDYIKRTKIVKVA